MSLGAILYSIIISPIECIIDWVFCFVNAKLQIVGVGGGIVIVSLVINFLTLPIYNVANKVQQKERAIQKKMQPWIKHIKHFFTGDERFMQLQAYYKTNHYHPLYAIRGTLPVLFEVPFFIAAYHYLSSCEYLNNTHFWILSDLSKPDGLITGINLLPFIMTLVNIISSFVYTKDSPFKEKLQLCFVAGIFLLLLYNSPSGLVLYWICNNLFSLFKNLLERTPPHYTKILLYLFTILLLSAASWYFSNAKIRDSIKISLYVITAIAAILPPLFILLRKFNIHFSFQNYIISLNGTPEQYLLIFLFSGIASALIFGFAMPSAIVASSPTEFSFLGKIESPLFYVFNTFCTFAGFFIFWPFVIFMMSKKHQAKLSAAMFLIFLIITANFFIFKHDYGTTTDTLFNISETALLNHSPFYTVLPIIFLIFVLCGTIFLFHKKHLTLLTYILFSLSLGSAIFGTIKSFYINKSFLSYKKNQINSEFPSDITNSSENKSTILHLSKNKKNVVVMFFDCAINSFLPYILEEEPELKEQLSGFTYYPNTLSFARNTSYCTPSMMGGYEYTPLELNKRTEVLLREKHNEATLVLPKLFLDAGYSVSVYDPPLPNYSYRGDLSAFENYQEIYVYETYGKFTDSYIADKKINSAEHNDDLCKSRMITFFAMRMLPPVLRLSFYGNCKKIKQNTSEFYNTFAPLYYLSDMTDAVSDNDTYIFFGNEVSHAPLFLDNDYEIESESNNSHCIYPSSNPLILRRYHANIAALKQFGKWINKLRELGVYDNTRIILVSDHGYDDEFILYDNKSYGDTRNISRFNPLLLFKDFDSNGELVTDNQFMTNADTIFLAKQNLDVSNINPFTNKELKQDKKYEGITVYPTYGQEMYVEYLKDKTQFTLKDGYFVKNNIFDKNNWQPLND